MENNLKLLRFVALPMAFSVAGCSWIKGEPKAKTEPLPESSVTVEQIADDPDLVRGVHKLTIKAEKAGTPNDLPCVLLVTGNQHRVALSCNYTAAHAPK